MCTSEIGEKCRGPFLLGLLDRSVDGLPPSFLSIVDCGLLNNERKKSTREEGRMCAGTRCALVDFSFRTRFSDARLDASKRA